MFEFAFEFEFKFDLDRPRVGLRKFELFFKSLLNKF